ncbi:TPA: 30S ribosomal protein S3 [bacterium]|nr:30S ribosomal protein S3 [bacterium]
MGQKVNPRGLRVGGVYTWDSIWYAPKRSLYIEALHEDLVIRRFIENYFSKGDIAKVVIERFGPKIKVNIHTARPGIVIGRGGEEIENVRKKLTTILNKDLQVDIYEVDDHNLEAVLVAKSVARSIERRINHRRAMKRAVANVMTSGAIGVKIACAGRLADAEIARTEWYREGKVPLHKLDAEIDYGYDEAQIRYGKIGVKVWIYKKGEQENVENA